MDVISGDIPDGSTFQISIGGTEQLILTSNYPIFQKVGIRGVFFLGTPTPAMNGMISWLTALFMRFGIDGFSHRSVAVDGVSLRAANRRGKLCL